MSRPKLVHLTTADISLSWLLGPQLKAFGDAGYEVIGVSAPGPYVADLAAYGVEHVPLESLTRAMNPLADLKALAELRRLFTRLQPDIVHTHNPKPGVYGRIAARAAGVPVVLNTIHGLYATPEDRFVKRAIVYSLERVAAACSQAELLQNVEDEPVLRRLRVPAERIHVVGNGIDMTRFSPTAVDPTDVAALRASWGAGPGDLVVGAVGRLVVEKGYRELFEVARRLRDQPLASGRRVVVVVVGPADPDKADGLSQAELDAAAADGVVLAGTRRDTPVCYAAMDLLVLASWREGFPRNPMEAAALGVPCVATDIRGCRQAVDDGTTGLLVPVRDPAALEAAVRSLLDDDPRRTAMGAAAQVKAAAEFDQDRLVAATLAHYERLLTVAGRPLPTPNRADGPTQVAVASDFRPLGPPRSSERPQRVV